MGRVWIETICSALWMMGRINYPLVVDYKLNQHWTNLMYVSELVSIILKCYKVFPLPRRRGWFSELQNNSLHHGNG